MAEPPAPSSALVAHVRRVDHDRFLCALFAPPDKRASLFALIAFNHEIARVRESVSEPMLGEIRLQWWRETLDGLYAGAVRRHQVAEALAAAITDHALSRTWFDRLIEARARDLADAPMADLDALQAYAEASATPLGALALEVLGAQDSAAAREATRHAATAFALVGLMRAVPFHARQSRLMLPADRMHAHGVDAGALLAGRFSVPLGAVIAEVLARARAELSLARQTAKRVPRAAWPALLPGHLAGLYARRLATLGCNPFDPRLALGPFLRQLSLGAALLIRRL
jgi:phytoene synthase